jgi:putative addiction module killer protein
MDVESYVTDDGQCIFDTWLDELKDITAATSIRRRINGLLLGNFGQVRPIQSGVWELKVNVGAGYRVYYAQSGKTILLLLCGGNKNSQKKGHCTSCQILGKLSISFKEPNMTIKPSRPYEVGLTKQLQREPAFAAIYLSDVLGDGEENEVALVLTQVGKAYCVNEVFQSHAKSIAHEIVSSRTADGKHNIAQVNSILNRLGICFVLHKVGDEDLPNDIVLQVALAA